MTTKPVAIANAVQMVNVHVHPMPNMSQPAGTGDSNGVCASNDISTDTGHPPQPAQGEDY